VKSLRSFAAILLSLLFWNVAGFAQSTPAFPRIQGETFAGRKVQLPEDVRGKVGVLIFGFTKASSKPTGAWAKKISADFVGREDFEL